MRRTVPVAKWAIASVSLRDDSKCLADPYCESFPIQVPIDAVVCVENVRPRPQENLGDQVWTGEVIATIIETHKDGITVMRQEGSKRRCWQLDVGQYTVIGPPPPINLSPWSALKMALAVYKASRV